MMTRRTFFRVVTLGTAPLVVGSLAWRDPLAWFIERSTARLLALAQTPEQRLRAHFDYLELDPAGVAQYFADYQRYRPAFSRRLTLGPDVYTRYLLSTDFFRRRADKSHPVHYVGFYEPSLTPCNNPFATFDEDSSSNG
jgi:hypothetical protein